MKEITIIKSKRIKLSEEELVTVFTKLGAHNYRELAKILNMDVAALYKQLNGQRNISDRLLNELDAIL